MDSNQVEQLKANRVGLAADWIRAIQMAPSSNPLNSPETMVHHVVPAWERIMATLECHESGCPATPDLIAEGWPPRCRSAQNPFRQFYLRGEQCLFDHSFVKNELSAAEQAELRVAFRAVAAEEICAFEGVTSYWRPSSMS